MATKKELFSTADEYLKYFKEEIERINKCFDKCDELEQITDKQIAAINAAPAGRGTQHYLVEHTTNMVSLQSQKQSLEKDIIALKKLAIEFAMKDLHTDGNGEEADAVMNALSELLARRKAEEHNKTLDNNDNNNEIDSEIEKRLEGDD